MALRQPPRTNHLLRILVLFICNHLGPHSFVLTTNSATSLLALMLTFRRNTIGSLEGREGSGQLPRATVL